MFFYVILIFKFFVVVYKVYSNICGRQTLRIFYFNILTFVGETIANITLNNSGNGNEANNGNSTNNDNGSNNGKGSSKGNDTNNDNGPINGSGFNNGNDNGLTSSIEDVIKFFSDVITILVLQGLLVIG